MKNMFIVLFMLIVLSGCVVTQNENKDIYGKYALTTDSESYILIISDNQIERYDASSSSKIVVNYTREGNHLQITQIFLSQEYIVTFSIEQNQISGKWIDYSYPQGFNHTYIKIDE